MLKTTNATSGIMVLGIGLGIVQLFDIFIHAVTDQLEMIRVSANIIVLLWLAVAASGRLNARFLQTAAGSVGAYLILNVIFLALEGVTNSPDQGGQLRIMLFLLMLLTMALSGLLIYRAGVVKDG